MSEKGLAAYHFLDWGLYIVSMGPKQLVAVLQAGRILFQICKYIKQCIENQFYGSG
jgi:hypothetical protein